MNVRHLTRRDFIKSVVLVPAGLALLPDSLVRAVMSPAGPGSRNLVLIDLRGGNDGLNMVVPYGLDGGTYYSLFRPTLAVPPNRVLPLTAGIGLNDALAGLKGHYDAGRLAIVQGVSYPAPNFSHQIAQRIWEHGDPQNVLSDGWLGRHLATLGTPSVPDAMAVASTLPRLLTGAGRFVPSFEKDSDFSFPFDDAHAWDQPHRRAAYAAIAAGLSNADPTLASMAAMSEGILELIDRLQHMPEFAHVGAYPSNCSLSKSLMLTSRLLRANLGMRHFHLPWEGFDTHADQELGSFHSTRLAQLSDGLHAFWQDLQAAGLADDTLVVVFSEFGRTVRENGSGGTDHGSVNPVLVFGNAVSGGLITEHPSMDPANLTAEGELPMTTDFRDVLGTIVSSWLGGDAGAAFPGHPLAPLPLLA